MWLDCLAQNLSLVLYQKLSEQQPVPPKVQLRVGGSLLTVSGRLLQMPVVSWPPSPILVWSFLLLAPGYHPNPIPSTYSTTVLHPSKMAFFLSQDRRIKFSTQVYLDIKFVQWNVRFRRTALSRFWSWWPHYTREESCGCPLSVAADFNGSQLLLSFISRQHQYITTDATNRTLIQHTWTMFVVLATTLDIILTLVINWSADDDDDVDEDYQYDNYQEDDNSNDSRWWWWWWWWWQR